MMKRMLAAALTLGGCLLSTTAAQAAFPGYVLASTGSVVLAGAHAKPLLCLATPDITSAAVTVRPCSDVTEQQWILVRNWGLAVPKIHLDRAHLGIWYGRIMLLPGRIGAVSFTQYHGNQWLIKLGGLCLSVPPATRSVLWERCGIPGAKQIWIIRPWELVKL
jgi:hypothetical protein